MQKSEQGLSKDRYQIVPRTLIFLFNQNRVLLLKGAADKKIWPGRYNGIGGHVERGEDVLSAARRELFEEAGLQGMDLWLCGTIIIDVEPGAGIGLYVMKGVTDLENTTPSHEGDLEWVSLDRLSEYPLVEDLFSLIPRIAAKPKGSAPFHAVYTFNVTGKLVIQFADE